MSQVHIVLSYCNTNYSSMQTIIDQTISELQRLLECAKKLQNRYLTQILFIQKVTNSTLKSNPYIAPKQISHKQLQKNEVPSLSVQDKAAALISLVQTRQRDIQNEKNETKPKFQTKLPQIIPQKKPPLPTANRNEKALKNFTPAYVPPRNKNEVTGKVTQTVMRTSAQKVFKPDRTSTKKNQPFKKTESTSQIKGRSSAQKIEKIEKKQIQISNAVKQVSQEPLYTQTKVQKNKPVNIQIESIDHSAKNIEVKAQSIKEKRVKHATFHKTIDQILQQILGGGPKNNRFQLSKKLTDCQNEEKGHKMREQQSRKAFIKKSCNYAVSRQKVYPMTSFQTARKKWTYHSQLFDFRDLLNNLQNELADLQLQKDCRIDKKTCFRISQSQNIYKEKIQEIRNDFQESKSNVPEKIDMTFSYKNICQAQKIGDEITDWHQISEEKVNENLLDFLQQITQRPTLQSKELRGLQVLTQVGTFRSKRAPVILLKENYAEWKKFYNKKTG